MKIYDAALVCRSKNAGPFQVTVDLMFSAPDKYHRVLESPKFTPEEIGKLYNVAPGRVAIKTFESILTIKVVLPRRQGSGSPLDTDVYGSQQHFPLGDLEI